MLRVVTLMSEYGWARLLLKLQECFPKLRPSIDAVEKLKQESWEKWERLRSPWQERRRHAKIKPAP
jgi:hypothetical protein